MAKRNAFCHYNAEHVQPVKWPGCNCISNGLNSLDNLLSLNTVITELMRPISIYGLDNLLSLMASSGLGPSKFITLLTL